MAKRFVLIDAHSIIYRSYYAFKNNPLKNRKGETTSGIFGFLNTLEKVKQNIGSEYIALAYDAPGKTFRDEIYKEYKATREPPPVDLPFQVDKVKDICRHLGISGFEITGYEADDILATIATQFQNQGDVFIVTSDKDLMQLVNERIFIYDAYKNLIYDKKEVIKKFGVPPDRIVEYLALVGDSIDNVPGVPGIGPKRAGEILNKYPRIEQAIDHEKRLSGKNELIALSQRLLELDQNVPLKISVEDLLVKPIDLDMLMPVLTELELHAFIRSITKTMAKQDTGAEVITDQPLGVPDEGIFSIHFELLSNTIYIAINENEIHKTTFGKAKKLIENKKYVKIGYDFKKILKTLPIESPFFDLKIIAWLLDPNRKAYSFDEIVYQYLESYGDINPNNSARLAGQLYHRLIPLLKAQNQDELYWSIEEPLIRVLHNIEQRGIKIDAPYLKKMNINIQNDIKQYEKTIYEHAGRDFNISSPKQLAQILFEDLKLTPVKRIKTGFSTDVEVLEQLGKTHPLPAIILKYRELSKLKSTYIEPLLNLARKDRIHTTFNQTGTATGRLSSINPNLQNIPIRKEIGRKLRQSFIAEPGYYLISADYSQIELRILAHITGDENLETAFHEKKDIHTHTAALVFNIPESQVNEEQRRMAKVVNYGLIYGMSDYGLAQGLEISREEAVQFTQSYYDLYPGVVNWRKQAIEFVEKNGYSETLFGRRRPLPDINSKNHTLREFIKRAAINTPIQGTAADLIKKAMINIENEMSTQIMKPGLILSVHDELVFEINEKECKRAIEIIRESMENVVKMSVPLEISINAGTNWAEIH